jgi:hypothetical protein
LIGNNFSTEEIVASAIDFNSSEYGSISLEADKIWIFMDMLVLYNIYEE